MASYYSYAIFTVRTAYQAIYYPSIDRCKTNKLRHHKYTSKINIVIYYKRSARSLEKSRNVFLLLENSCLIQGNIHHLICAYNLYIIPLDSLTELYTLLSLIKNITCINGKKKQIKKWNQKCLHKNNIFFLLYYSIIHIIT